jgi:hypothetical protein
MFDLRKLEWTELEPTGDTFDAREAHISFGYKDRYIFVVGGITESDSKQDVVMLDTLLLKWKA